MNNKKVRIAMIEADIRQWELAKLLNISESSLTRKLREELPEKEQDEIVALINDKGAEQLCEDSTE